MPKKVNSNLLYSWRVWLFECYFHSEQWVGAGIFTSILAFSSLKILGKSRKRVITRPWLWASLATLLVIHLKYVGFLQRAHLTVWKTWSLANFARGPAVNPSFLILCQTEKFLLSRSGKLPPRRFARYGWRGARKWKGKELTSDFPVVSRQIRGSWIIWLLLWVSQFTWDPIPSRATVKHYYNALTYETSKNPCQLFPCCESVGLARVTSWHFNHNNP